MVTYYWKLGKVVTMPWRWTDTWMYSSTHSKVSALNAIESPSWSLSRSVPVARSNYTRLIWGWGSLGTI